MTDKPAFFIVDPNPEWARTLSFLDGGKVALSIKFDPFRIVVAEGVELDAAAKVFLDAVTRLAK